MRRDSEQQTESRPKKLNHSGNVIWLLRRAEPAQTFRPEGETWDPVPIEPAAHGPMGPALVIIIMMAAMILVGLVIAGAVALWWLLARASGAG
jgi:hypothetical protein